MGPIPQLSLSAACPCLWGVFVATLDTLAAVCVQPNSPARHINKRPVISIHTLCSDKKGTSKRAALRALGLSAGGLGSRLFPSARPAWGPAERRKRDTFGLWVSATWVAIWATLGRSLVAIGPPTCKVRARVPLRLGCARTQSLSDDCLFVLVCAPVIALCCLAHQKEREPSREPLLRGGQMSVCSAGPKVRRACCS